MSGVLGLLIATHPDNLVVTVGSPGAGTFGFLSPSFGSISPANAIGQSVVGLFCDGSRDFELRLSDASLAKSFFPRLLVQNSAGEMVNYFTADATHSTGLLTSWRWGNGSSPVWTATGTRAVQICR
jgi:hypothetical protein